MNDFDHGPELERLAREQLTPQELREVLTRLGNEQFPGSEKTELGAVAEATHTQLLEVGRILADVRREQLSRTLGERVEAQELDLQRLDLAVRKLEYRHAEAYWRPEVQVSKASREITRFVGGLVTLAILVFLFFMLTLTRTASVRSEVTPAPPGIVTPAPPDIEGR